MTLNLLIVFKSGKKQPLIGADYSKICPQLDSKTKAGIISDVIILPDDPKEYMKILQKQGLTI